MRRYLKWLSKCCNAKKEKMMKILKFIIIIFTLCCCNEKEDKSVSINKNNVIDTLYITKHTLRGKDDFGNVQKKYLYNKKSFYLPKGEKIRIKMKFVREMEYLVDRCSVYLQHIDSGVSITKIDNYNFDLYIDSNYSNNDIKYDLYLSPQKKFLIRSIYSPDIVFQGNWTIICQYKEYVAQ